MYLISLRYIYNAEVNVGLILTNAKRITEAIWEDTNIEGARKRLFNVKMHMPYKEWCAVQIEYNTWAYTDSKAKLKTLMKKLGIYQAQTISY